MRTGQLEKIPAYSVMGEGGEFLIQDPDTGVKRLTSTDEEQMKKPSFSSFFVEGVKKSYKEQTIYRDIDIGLKQGFESVAGYATEKGARVKVGVGIGEFGTYTFSKETSKSIISTGLDIGSFITPGVGTAREYLLYGKFAEGGLREGFIPYTKEHPFEAAFVGIFAGKHLFTLGKKGMGIYGTVKETKVKKVTLTSSEETLIKQTSRQRATLILKTEKGKYILGKTKAGEYISFGGKIDKGETAKQAVLRELIEETGISSKSIYNFKKFGTIVTPEETFYTFTATLKKGVKIAPKSDITSFKEFSPRIAREWFGYGKGITGQTALRPVTSRGVRSYELGIINWIETGVKPTALQTTTKSGTFFLGTQSRYDVPFKNVKKMYEGGKEVLLAHGTPQGKLVKRFVPWEKELVIKASKSKRGVQGLYFQPPSYVKDIPVKSYERIVIKEYGGVLSPKDYVVKTESLFAKYQKVSGYTRTQQKGYVGISYLNIGKKPSESLGLKFGFKKPTVYTMKSKVGESIKPTIKAKRGIESEVIAEVGTVVKTTGRAEKRYLAAEKVYFQQVKEVKSVRAGYVSKLKGRFESSATSLQEKRNIASVLKKETGIEYGQYTYIEPQQVAGEISKPLATIKREEEISYGYKPYAVSKTRTLYSESYKPLKEKSSFKYTKTNYPSQKESYKSKIEYEFNKPYAEKIKYDTEKPSYTPTSYSEPTTPRITKFRIVPIPNITNRTPKEDLMRTNKLSGYGQYTPSLVAQEFGMVGTKQEVKEAGRLAIGFRPLKSKRQVIQPFI